MRGWVEAEIPNQAHPGTAEELAKFVRARTAYRILAIELEQERRHWWQRICWQNVATRAAVTGFIAATWSVAFLAIQTIVT